VSVVNVPLGVGSIDADLPDCAVTVAEPSGGEPVDIRAAAERAVEVPLGPSLETRVEPTDDVAIVVTDLTPAVPDDVLLDVLVERLEAIGVDRERITVVGLGLHRPMTDGEIEAMLGPHADLAQNHDPDAVQEVGTVDGSEAPYALDDTSGDTAGAGVPVEIGEPVVDANTVLSTGVVEPHQYAGFSGGAKTVVIGAGSESLIRYTHGPNCSRARGRPAGPCRGQPVPRDARRGGRPRRDRLLAQPDPRTDWCPRRPCGRRSPGRP
jgi:lactate racemase